MGATDFGSFDEFWKAFGRLYDSSVENTETIRELRGSITELRSSIKDLDNVAAKTLASVQQLHSVVTEHGRRLDRTEITVEAILEDLRRHREGRSPQ